MNVHQDIAKKVYLHNSNTKVNNTECKRVQQVYPYLNSTLSIYHQLLLNLPRFLKGVINFQYALNYLQDKLYRHHDLGLHNMLNKVYESIVKDREGFQYH